MENEKQNYINEEYKALLVNHEKRLDTANSEMGEVKIDLAQVKADVSWLVRFFWVVSSASIGGLITGILNLLW